MSTCPTIPSFSGIRIPPSSGKRAMPARRAMPKSRQPSTSAASAKTIKTPTTPKADTAKPKLSIALPPPPPPPPSTQRDSGPEDGEISDDEDDHYSPREATTPVHIPFGNPLEATSLNPPIPPLPPPVPSSSSFNSMNGRQSGDFSTREQLNLNTLRNITDPASMSIQELRKNALGAVMYLACSAKISFDDIVAEGVDRRVLAKYFDQLKLQMPPFEPRDLSKTTTATPTPIPTKGPASEAANGIKPTFPTPSAQSLPISTSVGIMANPPASLPPKPPLPTTIPQSLTPKPESVVSRFNQTIPTLSPTNGLISPPKSTPPPELNGQDTPQSAPESSTSGTASLRSRKRPVAADFDTEIKPSLLVSKQPRFGNRQSLETSHFIFEVSDNEDDGPKSSRLAAQPAGPSRPDSTTPEHNEKLGESLRQKEQEIEEMRRKIMAMSRKRKLAANGENVSGPPSQSSTPAPITPSAALVEAKDEKLEQVEQFLHQTLDQIEAGNLQPAAMDVAVNLVNSELMDVEAKTAELQLHSSQDRATSEQPSQFSTDSASEGAGTTASPETDLAPEPPIVPLSSDPKSAEEKVPLDDGSLETTPIELDTVSNGSLYGVTGSPMDLSDLESTSSEMESDSEGSSKDRSGSEGSDIKDVSSDDDDASSDQSDDVEMHDSSLEASPGLDSASSPLHGAADDDGYDPETHKSDIGETSLLPEIPGVSQNQPPTVPDFATFQPPKIPTKVLPSKRKDGEYTPYQSALSGFKSFRYHPGYTNLVSQGFKSLTYSNHIDSELPVCDFETRGGTCNDPQCRWQHFRQMVLPEDQILLELSEPDDTQPDKEKYQSSLAETIAELNNSGETGDFDKIASNIVEYRRQQLGDPTRIIRNLQ
ncbi:hypothetical protein H072_8480 [Dactylellina haptotyla CBS 200.50]|uniref:Putative zinc-finger domain-containing protein n=1 Tax=Dactylellina haptotyla (strain CBS 200.50) TaxID=1284197 RepID=S8A486_DACHA|nr:hypothetical protein H072_8480 [Dactylellina haptotyla CBS 200.50]